MQEERKVEEKNLSKKKSILDTQVFLVFGNFYESFIKSFKKLANPPTLMLITSFNLFSTISKSLKHRFYEKKVDENRVYNRRSNKKKLYHFFYVTKTYQSGLF